MFIIQNIEEKIKYFIQKCFLNIFLPDLLNVLFPVDIQAVFFWQVLALSEIPHKLDNLYPP